MTDPVIPIEAVEAAARSLYQSDAQGQWEHGELDLLLAYRDAARAAVAAALPHLRPPICGDVACPGLGNCEDPDCLPARCEPLLKTATDVALKLGRQEAAEEIADEMLHVRHRNVPLGYRQYLARIARDTGKGDS